MSINIFAHRGASMYTPENTFAAFDLAVQMGAEGIETDVQLTKDQVPVLIHDEKLNRTTNGRGWVKDFTFNQLKQLDAGSWFSPLFKDTPLVSLEEFLIWAKDNSIYINLELKNNRIDYPHLEAITYEMVTHHQVLDQTIISSFNPKSVARLKPFRKTTEIALIITRRLRRPIMHAKKLNVHALHIEYRALRKPLINQAQRENIPLRVFTVNHPRRMMRCFTKQCAAIFTDVPDEGLKYRDLFLGGST